MNLKILPPDEDRKEFFEKSLKPLLIAADDNNAVDKWMFNLKDDGEVDTSSVVLVSAVKKMIFVTKKFYKTTQPQKLKQFIPENKDKDLMSKLASDLAKNMLSRRPKDYVDEYIHPRKRSSSFLEGVKKDVERARIAQQGKTVRIELEDGSFEEMLETWSVRILVYDISDSRFIEKVIEIQGTKKMPTIEDFCRDLDFQSLFLNAKHGSFPKKVSYQSVCSKWKKRKKD